MLVTLALRTRIPVSAWERESPTVLATAVEMLLEQQGDQDDTDEHEQVWRTLAGQQQGDEE